MVCVAPLVGAWIEMREINEVIRAAIPEAREKISWLPHVKTMWGCIRDRRLWRNLWTG